MKPFIYVAATARIIFGPGSIDRTADEVGRMGGKRALVLSTSGQTPAAEALANRLGALAVGVYANAQMHTPVEVTEQALATFSELGADCVVSIGGGSTIGLGKAISWRNGARHLVVATTYAGSEVTDILGETTGGVKTTLRDPKILPDVVIYDPALTLDLPIAVSVVSGLNAMAHAIEGLYAKDANPLTSMMAVEGLRSLQSALPRIVREPRDLDARGDALYGSWLCGAVLGAVAMSLHHKLCHTLGGALDLPHAETHAVLLPHTAAFNQLVAAEALEPAAARFGDDLGVSLQDFARSLGAPLALRDLGVKAEDLPRVADLAAKNPYWNPRAITRDSILELLQRAFVGARPEPGR